MTTKTTLPNGDVVWSLSNAAVLVLDKHGAFFYGIPGQLMNGLACFTVEVQNKILAEACGATELHAGNWGYL